MTTATDGPRIKATHRASRELLSPGQVATILGVSASTVRNWTRAGWLPDSRLPSGFRRYHLADVQALGLRLGLIKPETVPTDAASDTEPQ